VKLLRSAPERTLSETTSFTTSSNLSKPHSINLPPLPLFPYATSSPQTVGVIYKTERDSFRVLDQNGQTRLVKPHQISMRRDSARAVANDAEGHELRINDNVKEIDGLVSIPLSSKCIRLSVISLTGTKRTCHPHPPVILRFLTQ
jgi:transcription elongation factor